MAKDYQFHLIMLGLVINFNKNEKKNNGLFVNLDKEVMNMPNIPSWISFNLKTRKEF